MLMKSPLSRVTLLAALLAAATTGCSSGDSSSDGKVDGITTSASTKANTFTAGDQQTPAVARNSAGDSVVVWDSEGQDGSLAGVYGQRYKNGTAVGAEFRVNTFTSNKQNMPSVAMDSVGNFVVVWRSSNQDSNGGTIYGQRFAANGNPLGAEFQIGPADSDFDSQADPSVAMNERGDFVVVFSNRELNSLALFFEVLSSERRDIQAIAYSANGTAITGVISVISSTGSIERSPVTGIDATGNFVVSWLSDGSPSRIMSRRYAADGTALGDEFQVNDSVSANDRPAMAMNRSGNFVISWERAVNEPELTGIYARLYDASGNALGPQFQVSNRSAGMLERTTAAMAADGSFIIGGQAEQNANGGGIFLQRFSATGLPQGSTTLVSDAGTLGMFGKVAMDPSGGVSVAWQSFKQDGDGRGVYTR